MRVGFINAHIVTGDGSEHARGSLVVEGRRIVAVENGETRDADHVIDIEGRTLIPGLIDMHTHLAGGDNAIAYGDENISFRMSETIMDSTLAAIEAAEVTLNAGVTTVREAAARDYIDVALREFQRRGQIVAPRIRAAGPGISMTGGHGCFFDPANVADGPDEVVKRVRTLVSRGVDWVKVISTDGPETNGDWSQTQSTREELSIAFAEAKRLGRRTMAHALGAEGIGNAVLAGADTIEHGRYLSEENCVDMAKRGTLLSPTTGNVVMFARHGWDLGMPWADHTASDGDAVYERHAMAVQMGVGIVMGSDCGGNEARVHGTNALELQCLVRSGMNTMQAIESATSLPARALGIDNEVGSIRPGLRADFVIIDGDPLTNIELTLDGVIGVVQDGRVRRDDLGMMEALRRAELAKRRTLRSQIRDNL